MCRNLIFSSKAVVTALKHMQVPLPDSIQMGRLFISGIKCMSMFENVRSKDGKSELKEMMEAFGEIFAQTDLLIFQEIFESRLPIFLDEVIVNPELLLIPQYLLGNKDFSHAFVNILFRFLVTLLPDLGSREKDAASVLIRLFKMAFMAVTIYPEANESTLLPHLSHIITSSLRLAVQAKEPSSYYLLLRALFRSIGGGRFENLYKEVLPLLQVVLENLNGLLVVSDRIKRDLYVELCLTVPVRLSVLLPFLSYLMRPLVLSLESGSELVTQGLRTLELCVDNLTQDFLTPLLAPVLPEVMTALWKLLKPAPLVNPAYSHQTLRILGKIGGRNRRVLGPNQLNYTSPANRAQMLLKFEDRTEGVALGPIVELAFKTLKRGDVHYRRLAFTFLKHTAATILQNVSVLTSFAFCAQLTFIYQPPPPSDQDDTFGQAMRGLIEATKPGDESEEATAFVLEMAHYIFELEIRSDLPEGALSRLALPLCSLLLDALTESIAACEAENLPRLLEMTQTIIDKLLSSPTISKESALAVLRQLASRLSTCCYNSSWSRKCGGAAGLRMLGDRVRFEDRWLGSHELELVRALLFMLKDSPTDPPASIHDAAATLLRLVRTLSSTEQANEGNQVRLSYLVGLLIVEVCSQVDIIRETSKEAIKILAEASGASVSSILFPVRERLLAPIIQKPLRALAFAMQIGHIDAITYCIQLDPPLLGFDQPHADPAKAAPEPNSAVPPSEAPSSAANAETGSQNTPASAEGQSQATASGVADQQQVSAPTANATDSPLGRILVEALGIADADDQALAGRSNLYKNSAYLTKLRVVCVQLLSAGMNMPEFALPAQQPLRMRILSVYFKLLYSRSKEVVEAASTSLSGVLKEHGRLPKELLQSGLRPVLVKCVSFTAV